MGEIRDPVHGYIYFTEVERRLIDSPPLQRLRRIRQLAGAELVYPGACHSRFPHSLGVMHLSGILAERLAAQGYLDKDEVQKVRVASLLHDVGHGPFSHVYEEVLDKHRGMTHEDITRMIVKASEVKDVLSDYGFTASEVADLSVGRLEATDKPYLNQVIAGPLSSDIMDYLLRDSYFAGVEFGKVDVRRLIDSIDVVENTLAVDYPGAFYVLESLLIARLEMFNAVYFHRTVRAANVMLSKSMDLADEHLGLTSFKNVEGFLLLDDVSVSTKLLTLHPLNKDLSRAQMLMKMFLSRALLKSAYELTVHRQDEFLASLFSNEFVRRQLEHEICARAGVDADFVVIDVPTVLSVPAYPSVEGPSAISLYVKGTGKLMKQRFTELSPLMASLSRFVNIIRVYTLPEFRDRVGRACIEIFKQKPFSERTTV